MGLPAQHRYGVVRRSRRSSTTRQKNALGPWLLSKVPQYLTVPGHGAHRGSKICPTCSTATAAAPGPWVISKVLQYLTVPGWSPPGVQKCSQNNLHGTAQPNGTGFPTYWESKVILVPATDTVVVLGPWLLSGVPYRPAPTTGGSAILVSRSTSRAHHNG